MKIANFFAFFQIFDSFFKMFARFNLKRKK